VRGFVEAHGGKIDVTSTPQDGTHFTFTLPQAT
jgi:signal transduction histidine kinase